MNKKTLLLFLLTAAAGFFFAGAAGAESIADARGAVVRETMTYLNTP